MGIVEQIRLALRALSVNKLRSTLTMLGIIIGVGAVITLLSVGQGVQALVADQLQSIGTNLLFVVPGNLDQATMGRSSSGLTLSLKDAEAIADPFNVPDAVGVAPEVMASVREVRHGKADTAACPSQASPRPMRVRNSRSPMELQSTRPTRSKQWRGPSVADRGELLDELAPIRSASRSTTSLFVIVACQVAWRRRHGGRAGTRMTVLVPLFSNRA